jgi:hypothetical protein
MPKSMGFIGLSLLFLCLHCVNFDTTKSVTPFSNIYGNWFLIESHVETYYKNDLFAKTDWFFSTKNTTSIINFQGNGFNSTMYNPYPDAALSLNKFTDKYEYEFEIKNDFGNDSLLAFDFMFSLSNSYHYFRFFIDLIKYEKDTLSTNVSWTNGDFIFRLSGVYVRDTTIVLNDSIWGDSLISKPVGYWSWFYGETFTTTYLFNNDSIKNVLTNLQASGTIYISPRNIFN